MQCDAYPVLFLIYSMSLRYFWQQDNWIWNVPHTFSHVCSVLYTVYIPWAEKVSLSWVFFHKKKTEPTAHCYIHRCSCACFQQDWGYLREELFGFGVYASIDVVFHWEQDHPGATGRPQRFALLRVIGWADTHQRSVHITNLQCFHWTTILYLQS